MNTSSTTVRRSPSSRAHTLMPRTSFRLPKIPALKKPETLGAARRAHPTRRSPHPRKQQERRFYLGRDTDPDAIARALDVADQALRLAERDADTTALRA